jgi:hypothetical protein
MLYAIGKPGQPVRTFLETDPIDVGRQRLAGETIVIVTRVVVDAVIAEDGSRLVAPN